MCPAPGLSKRLNVNFSLAIRMTELENFAKLLLVQQALPLLVPLHAPYVQRDHIRTTQVNHDVVVWR